jgi:hypothetical protein
MNSEISLIQQKPKQKKPHNFYVYFDEWTGTIKVISGKIRDDITDPYLKTSDPIVVELMKGIKNTKKYIVADLVDGYKLVEKKNYLRIKQAENYLSKVPLVKPTVNKDINIVLYLSDYKVEVNVSTDLIYQLTGKINSSEVKIQKDKAYESIVLYIVEKNNPLHLLETIEIDPVDLIQKGYILFDFSNLRNTIALGDIDILTRRIFKSYGLKIKQNYVTVDYGLAQNNKRFHTRVKDSTTEEFATFSVSPSTQGWIIKSNFVDPHEYKIYKDIHMFLTGNNPNMLLENITIPFDNIGKNQEYIIKTKVDPTTCKILLGPEGKNITFKFEGLEYAESGKY